MFWQLMKFASSEVRRARPLLGTFVEITARGENEVELHRAIDHAFDAAQRVHRLMSFHDPASDVSRVNRAGFPKGVIVRPWTWQVLQAAQEFARESGGAFDMSVASLLTEWNYLPRAGYSLNRTATWKDIFLRKNYRVFCRRPIVVDLGGIAKGFAVDRAVKVLQRDGILSGIVNAGGDLRVFGSDMRTVHLRHPLKPGRMAGAISLRDRALATSASYFSRPQPGQRQTGPLINGRTRRAISHRTSVSVAAADCMTADALTKIVFALREKSAPLLARYRADAVLLERSGQPAWVFQSSCDQTR
ncbi:MAG: FAD:protein FMN transferase [Rhodanobacteraceae bacterium]